MPAHLTVTNRQYEGRRYITERRVQELCLAPAIPHPIIQYLWLAELAPYTLSWIDFVTAGLHLPWIETVIIDIREKKLNRHNTRYRDALFTTLIPTDSTTICVG